MFPNLENIDFIGFDINLYNFIQIYILKYTNSLEKNFNSIYC